jgi:hypothetical protein
MQSLADTCRKMRKKVSEQEQFFDVQQVTVCPEITIEGGGVRGSKVEKKPGLKIAP